MSIWYARVGDANKNLTTVLGDSAGTPLAIPTSATVTFIATKRDTQVIGTATANANQSSHAGQVSFSLNSAALATIESGWYEVHWRLHWTDGTIDTFPLGGFDTLVIEPAP